MFCVLINHVIFNYFVIKYYVSYFSFFVFNHVSSFVPYSTIVNCLSFRVLNVDFSFIYI